MGEMMEEIIRVESISKEYRLGALGGATLKEDLQSWYARLRKREDPNKKIGAKTHASNERFLALDGVSFTAKAGEALGIIGHNGAGKSTLLKLLSRVTAPTKGRILLNGRITSMLEVGTGFHPELTGRENIFLNGAILGMTKAEITRKFDEIVAFSEVEKFIDTPVKRYSSGMYVKLAFSVASHLESEIMIMDEVLAVGDMAFQQKCIEKMKGISQNDGRTILYVSHNMSTIRNLCTRCIVLDQGKLIFDGETEKSIEKYIGTNEYIHAPEFDLKYCKRCNNTLGTIQMNVLRLTGKRENVYKTGEPICAEIDIEVEKEAESAQIKMIVFAGDGTRVGYAESEPFKVRSGDKGIRFKFDTSCIADGDYYIELSLIESSENGSSFRLDTAINAFTFVVDNSDRLIKGKVWSKSWGHTIFPTIEIEDIEHKC
jgi:ABC-type polysaccharide/polyol phosphate transport system ATPase subunit